MPQSPPLRPREHGAYAMLTFPILSGWVLGGVSWPGVAFAAAAVAGLLAHEALAVTSGGRGERRRSLHEGAARRTLARLAAVLVVAGGAFALLAPRAAWLPAILALALVSVVGVLAYLGRTKTLAGEVVVAVAFAWVHGVVAAAAGEEGAGVFAPVAVWAVSFVAATLAVHAIKFRFKPRGPSGWTVVATPVVALAMGGVAVAAWVGWAPGGGWTPRGSWAPWAWVAASLLPKALVVGGVSVVPVHPRHLKRVGWTLVAADTTTLALLALALGGG